MKDNTPSIIARAPIITVAGHIDHGKTTFLNYISAEKNPQKEYGGITQHIKAYYITTVHGPMTFLDTPGHFAFNSNRENCIKISDIVLLIISAEDGIKPQTVETINIAKKFNISVVVAISKIDKFLDIIATEERILHELNTHNLTPEKWGGDIIVVPMSSKTGFGINNLLDMLKLQSDLLDLKIDNTTKTFGIILENKIDIGKGAITTLILKNGMLKRGDVIQIATYNNKIKNIYDVNHQVIDYAFPSLPVEVTGITSKFNIGDNFFMINTLHKKNTNISLAGNEIVKDLHVYNIDSLMNDMQKNNLKKINIVVKVDVLGSVQVLKNLIEGLSTSEIKINIIKIDIGNFSDSDLDLAVITGSFLLGFNIRIDNNINKQAIKIGIEWHVFNIIYELLDFLHSKLDAESVVNKKHHILGVAEIKKIFKHKDNLIAGCLVISGKIKQQSHIKIKRQDVIIYDGIVESIKIYKLNVKEVKAGHECGVNIKNFNKFQVNDIIEVF